MPDFLRIAARTVAKRPDKGRHSPSRKAITLHSRNDGIEIDNVLRDWENGLIPTRDENVIIKRPIAVQRDRPTPARSRLAQILLPPSVPIPDYEPHGKTKLTVKSTGKADTPRKLRQSRITPIHLQRNDMQHISRLSRSDQPRLGPSKRDSHNVRRYEEVTTRPGQLESLQHENDARYPHAAFRRQLSSLDRQFNSWSRHRSSTSNPNMARFLAEEDIVSQPAQSLEANQPEALSQPQPPLAVRSRPRKRRPRQLQLHEMEIHRATVLDESPDRGPSTASTQIFSPNGPVIQGLGRFGTTFTNDFGVHTLPVGVCFHHSTFIGSGEFKAALRLHKRDLDHSAGYFPLQCGDLMTRLGPWNEETAARLDTLYNIMSRTIESLNKSKPSRETGRPRVEPDPRAFSDLSYVIGQVL